MDTTYKQDYHTGADISVFIGPLWVEEAVSIYLRTTTNDIVVYPYSDPHYSRSLVGRYMMQGTLTVNCTEPDYLLRLIELARKETITQSALRELIEKRKSVFQQTLTDRLLAIKAKTGTLAFGAAGTTTEEKLLAYVTDYTERVTREVELMSLRYTSSGQRVLDPRLFELTIISGNPSSPTTSIEIFEDVKIVGTEQVNENNDATKTVTYSIIARRKPPLVVNKPVIQKLPRISFVTENLLAGVKTIADHIVKQMLENVELRCFSPTVRAAAMLHNPNVGYIGDVSDRSRFYGTTASYLELVWQVKTPPFYTVEQAKLPSVSIFALGKNGTWEEKETSVKLTPPPYGKGKAPAFSNAYGRMLSVNKDDTLDGLVAAAPVEITPLEANSGYGTIYAPRKRKTGFGMGSLIPPVTVDPETFSFLDKDVYDVTASTLWSNPFNVRGCSRNIDPNALTEESETRLTEIVQPMYTYGIMREFTVDGNGISFTLPTPIDYTDLTKGDVEDQLVAEDEIPEGMPTSKITIHWDGTVEAEDVREDEIIYSVAFTSMDIRDIPTREELLDDESPCFGLFTLDCGPAATEVFGFNRFTTVRPIIFSTVPQLSEVLGVLYESGGVYYVPDDFIPDGLTDDPSELADVVPLLPSYGKGCDTISIDYDVFISEKTSTYVDLSGCFFAQKRETKFKPPGSNTEISYEDIVNLKNKLRIHIMWLFLSVPSQRALNERQQSTEGEAVSVVHDTVMQRSRVSEFYTFLRCDTRYYDILVMNTPLRRLANQFLDIWEDVWTSLKGMFTRIGTISRTIDEFTYPVKASVGRVSQQFLHYTVDVAVQECGKQLAACTIAASDVEHAAGGKLAIEKNAEGAITLLDALSNSVDRAGNAFVGGTKRAQELITIQFRVALREALEKIAADIRGEDDRTGIVTVRRYTIPVLSSLVCYGLTESGYQVLREEPPEDVPGLLLPHYTDVEENREQDETP